VHRHHDEEHGDHHEHHGDRDHAEDHDRR
jgi:hypothetical protein